MDSNEKHSNREEVLDFINLFINSEGYWVAVHIAQIVPTMLIQANSF